MEQPQHKMPVREFLQQYSQYYLKQCNLDELKKDLANVIRVCIILLSSRGRLAGVCTCRTTEFDVRILRLQFTAVNGEQFIELTPLHRFACDVYRVMMNCGGTLNLSQFDVIYSTIIGTPCKPAQYGFPTLIALLQALPCTVTIKDIRKKRKVIYLNKKLAGKR